MKTKFSKAVNTARGYLSKEKEVAHQIQLIQGSFAPSEAADILLSFINDKIKFHTVKKLNSNDSAQTESDKRIEALKLAKAKVTALVLEARNTGNCLEINSTIEIVPRKNLD